ncbi:type III secretion apparatus protein RspB [Pseudomonas sp. B6002]|uniref:EscI/YscI/HrpB family type III secretion system inner rod protein n=1 Tax=Pseudomonas sp. B6002 TaxID=2726978 RepID=UPI0015A0C05B|nr:EscI/YscI/HrpB family type III secretion system inner rod protein [Pseudomonas sp. B6002]NVZ49883.1 type III secretion apparatus protein RspB [Pseudomonas sp. B6002]
MKIEKLDFSVRQNGLEEAVNTPSHSASNTDVDFFTASLNRSGATTTRVDNPPGPSLLTEAGQHVKALETRLAHALKSTNKGSDPDDFKQYPRELSNVILTSQLLVKSLGKATQCLDKICNLQ